MPRYDKPQDPSPETQAAAQQIARATQRPGQTKEQTRLIAQGIQKGIEEYKRQQKARAREADKQRKRQLRFERHASTVQTDDLHLPDEVADAMPSGWSRWLPWALLLLSWAGFLLYLLLG